MKAKKIIIFLLFFMSFGLVSSYAQPTLHLNGRSANANLFDVTGDYNCITVNAVGHYSYIRIDYYVGNNYYSQVLTSGVPFYLSGITSFTISSSYSSAFWDETQGIYIYNAYETEMYVIY